MIERASHAIDWEAVEKEPRTKGTPGVSGLRPTAYFGHTLRARLFALAIFLIFSASCALAQDSSFDEMLKIDTPKIATTSPDQYRWSVEVLATGLGDVTNRHVQMGGMTAGVGYYVFPQVAIQLDVTGYGFSEGRSSGAAAGITLGIRHHIASIGKTSVFLDVAGGEIEASNNIPYGGTHLNNTIQFGFGVAHPLSENMYLLAGARYYHISNASSEGSDRNPSVNAIQGFVGLMWRF